MNTKLNPISQIRSFNRFYINVLGLLDQHILDSNYSLTEVRVLLEISKTNRCTANNLADPLKIDHSYMSRILKHLEADHLIARVQADHDKRINFIVITEKGTCTIENLNQKSDEQILKLTKNLTPTDLCHILNGMKLIKKIMSETITPITIRNFVMADIEYVISRHKNLYQNEYNLSPIFGNYVDTGVHDFVENFDADKECMLIAIVNAHPVGSIAVANVDNKTAHLRYYLLEPEVRGQGLGQRLIDKALLFCRDKNYTHVFLETISALKTARYIYKSKGFAITHTHENPAWGTNVVEERWDLDL